MSKTLKLRKLITSNNLEFIMEAHNGLSAKIVEEAGFKAIWASSLSISASMGLRDNNEASWSQVLEILEFMADATTIPILFDGDTGYGNFNNARMLVKKLEQRGIAGVCIEDKLFPKTNSFIKGETQPLADTDEFCGKIKAMKDAQDDKNFVVVARVEALIAGWGIQEALRRAENYKKAGADAILIHSKKNDASEITEFMKQWKNRHPVIIVPTKYFSTPTEIFKSLGISIVIWANHTLRSSIKAMQNTTRRIFNDQNLLNVEYEIAPVSEIFRLQKAEELIEAEKKYLPVYGKNVNAIILAAAKGDELKELTADIPKTLLKVKGKTILANLTESFNNVGIKDITVVRGYAKEKVAMPNIKTIDNDEYAGTSELYSLFLAKDQIKENTIVCFGDIIFKNYILNDLLNDNNDITIVVDADYEYNNEYHDYVKTSGKYSKKLFSENVTLEKMSGKLKKDEICGEFIGVFKANKNGAKIIKDTLQKMKITPNFKKLRINDLFNEISKTHPIKVQFIKGAYLDINNIIDLQKSGDF